MEGMTDELEIAQECVKMHSYSQHVIHLANHDRIKHIDIHFNFAKDMIESEKIEVEKVVSKENLANAFTKSLPRLRFKHCLDLINFVEE